MRRVNRTMLMLVAFGVLAVPQGRDLTAAKPDARAVPMKTENDRTLYALGHTMGSNLKVLGLSAEELVTVIAGLRDAANGDEPQVDLNVFIPKIRDLARARATRSAETEKKRSEPYLEAAAGEEGATRTASGLIYLELAKGTGPSPGEQETVRVHYRGMLTDGTEFDSSHKRGEPAEFLLKGVIACWSEGLQKMAVGGRAKLICPSSIAYGDNGRPPLIPPGATLVFEIELLEIVKG